MKVFVSTETGAVIAITDRPTLTDGTTHDIILRDGRVIRIANAWRLDDMAWNNTDTIGVMIIR